MSALDHQVGETSHYRHGKIQPVVFIEANKLQFLEGCVVKRVTRHDKPGGKGKQDIEKAIHELQLLLEQRYPVDALPGDHPQPVYEDVERLAKVAEPDADGWTPRWADTCPLNPNDLVEVKFRSGNYSAAGHAHEFCFELRGGQEDIIAYRLVKEEPQWPMVSEPGDHSKIKAAYKPGMEWNVDGGIWVAEPDRPNWYAQHRYAIRPAQGAQA